jgi:hypothetical protein
MNGDLFFTQPGIPEHTEPHSEGQRPAAPARACLVCGAQNWQWDSQIHKYACGSNRALHEERLRLSWISQGEKVPEPEI